MPEFDQDDPTTWPDHLVIGVGMVHAAVCTRGTDEEATTFVNHEWPTGISSAWAVDPKVKIPWVNAADQRDCPDDPARRHLGFSC